MAEQWLPVAAFAGYEVSDLGRVRSVDRTVTQRSGTVLRLHGRILAAGLDGEGYPNVGLRRPGVSRTYRVHELVLTAFRGVRPPGMEGCHDNGDPTDNRLVNLHWGTRAANTADTVRHGTHRSSRKTACPRGHLLEGLNLEPNQRRRGRRSCYACHLTRSGPARAARRAGCPFDFQWEADRRYREILASST